MTFRELRHRIAADQHRYDAGTGWRDFTRQWLKESGFRFTVLMRLCAFLRSQPLTRYGVYHFFLWLHRRMQVRYGTYIEFSTQVGPGLYVGHANSIVINTRSVIGANCTLSHGVTAGARVPPGAEPALYEHIRAVAPNHRHVPAGISDVMRFEPTVEQNPDAAVAVLRGALGSGMRDFTFDVVGNGFVRITGYLVRERDVARVDEGARHSSTVLGAAAIGNQHLRDRVPKPAPVPVEASDR